MSHLNSFKWYKAKIRREIDRLEKEALDSQKRYHVTIANWRKLEETLDVVDDNYTLALTNKVKKECKDLKIEDIQPEEPRPESERNEVAKARTLKIFFNIISSIEEFSTDAFEKAPDVTVLNESILFPLIFEPVMRGEEAYYLDDVPNSALEVVKRGREWVQFFRESVPVAMSTPEGWEHQGLIQEWWVNDALPLLYGERDDGWIDVKPYSHKSMMKWKDEPLSQALEAPLIHDAFELMKKHGEEIYETTKLREFTRASIETRLDTK